MPGPQPQVKISALSNTPLPPNGTEYLIANQSGTTYKTTSQAVANLGAPVTQQGTSYTVQLTDAGTYIQFTSGSALTLTIPANATVAFNINTEISFEQTGAGTITVSAAGGVTLNASGGHVNTAQQYAVCTIKKVAVNTWTLFGERA